MDLTEVWGGVIEDNGCIITDTRQYSLFEHGCSRGINNADMSFVWLGSCFIWAEINVPCAPWQKMKPANNIVHLPLDSTGKAIKETR